MKTVFFFSWQHLWSMKNKAGAPSYHHTINYYINSEDWDVYLFTADSSNRDLSIANDDKVFVFSDKPIVEKVSSISKINHISLPVKHKDYTKWAVDKASAIIEKTNKDKILLYGYEIWGVEAAKRLSEKYDLPLVTRFQGTILSYEKHNLVNRVIHYPHYEALETPADLIVMTDDGTMGDITLKDLGNTSHTLFLRNGLDLYNQFRNIYNNKNQINIKKELGIEDKYALLMASRLTSWKRVDRGIRALKKVLEARKDVVLIIAGDGDSRSDLEELTKELELDKNVIFLGSVPQSELYKYMLCADVFLSLYDLGNLGNPTFEAMLMRMPIIALNGGSTSSVLHNGENAVLLEYEDEQRIPEEIIALFDNEEYRERIRGNAYEYAVNNFYSWETRMKIEENAILKMMEMRK